MQIYNFLSRKIEEFKPIGETVGLYTCGPTVYDFVHIGNWRTFVFEDILKRVLIFNGYNVKHVMNLTDIDDKIIKRANEEKVSIGELTEKFANAFFDDLSKLNIIRADVYPRATGAIESMVKLIEKLLDAGFAYKGEEGIYFSVEKFKEYGKLSGLDKKNLKKGARVASDEYDKESWTDFALWKFHKEGEPSWDASFGKGRPGWHIECSAMSISELGESIDIHTGGVDLLFPHHENEIAQSEAATGKKFVNVWMEGEHLLVDNSKMAKRDKNIFTLKDVIEKGFDPLALRYLFLTANYRSKMNFTWESLQSAQNALHNLRKEVGSWDRPFDVCCGEHLDRFTRAINEDLDMPKAVAVMWDLVKTNNPDHPSESKRQTIELMDDVLGLGLRDLKAKLPKEAKELIERREKLRNEGKYDESDELREQLKSIGIEIEDTPNGTKWKVVGGKFYD